MMKDIRCHIVLFASLLAFGSCARQTYAGAEEDYSNSTEPVPVQVYVGNPRSGVDVKGSGPMDNLADFTGKKILVYAFLEEPDVIYNQASTEGTVPQCLIDGLTATVMESEARAWWDNLDAVPSYPNRENSSRSYSFFAAYTDDCQYTASKEADAIYLNLSIDGTHDLMTAMAIPPKGASFCYAQARKQVHPVFSMKHDLVKLRFRVKGGLLPGVTPEEVPVSELKISTPTRARLCIASANPSVRPLGASFPGNSQTSFPYLDPSTGEQAGTVTVSTAEINPVPDSEAVFIGGESACIMVAPSTEYKYSVKVGEKTFDRILKRAGSEPFLPGNSYIITFEVWGHNSIGVTVGDPEPWEQGEDLTGTDVE